jgi:hypothetical protein
MTRSMVALEQLYSEANRLMVQPSERRNLISAVCGAENFKAADGICLCFFLIGIEEQREENSLKFDLQWREKRREPSICAIDRR